MPENPTKQAEDKRAAVMDDLLADTTPDKLMADLRSRAEARNRAAQADVPPPAAQPDSDWATRKAYLLDNQPVHGDTRGLADFFYPALAALQADDQVTFSRQRDLLFKALRTALGDPPVEAVAPDAPLSKK